MDEFTTVQVGLGEVLSFLGVLVGVGYGAVRLGKKFGVEAAMKADEEFDKLVAKIKAASGDKPVV